MEQALKYQAVEATAEKELLTDTLGSKETPAAIATTREREMTDGGPLRCRCRLESPDKSFAGCSLLSSV